MAYTVSELSFILEKLEKSIIITGSQIPILEIRSDRRKNLLNSLLIIEHYPINKVTLFFNNKLYKGNRTTKSNADGFNAFSSSKITLLLEMGINVRYLYKDKFLKKQKN